jgi:hypothetical protein
MAYPAIFIKVTTEFAEFVESVNKMKLFKKNHPKIPK